MFISLIAAVLKNRVIGKKNKLPWHLPADFAHFKKLTMGHPVIMGKNTFLSIGKPLPNRTNIVLVNDGFTAEGCLIARSLDDALALAKKSTGGEEIFIIGGASVYAQFLPRANRLYLTFIDAGFDGDAYFPEWNKNEWREASREPHAPDEKNPYAYTFVTFERKSS